MNAVCHGLLHVPEPEFDQVFRCSLLTQPSRTEPPHRMKTRLLYLEFFQDTMEGPTKQICLRNWLTHFVGEQESRLASANKSLEQFRQVRIDVHLSVSVLGLWCLNSTFPTRGHHASFRTPFATTDQDPIKYEA
jgi:hypothetical protein